MHYKWILWKQRALGHVARLEKQIEFLEGKEYTGCGVHYALLPDLRATKRQIEGLEAASEFWRPIVAKVRLESATETIKKAVQDAKRRMQ